MTQGNVQIGVVSFGSSCGQPGLLATDIACIAFRERYCALTSPSPFLFVTTTGVPAVYARVSGYQEWITQGTYSRRHLTLQWKSSAPYIYKRIFFAERYLRLEWHASSRVLGYRCADRCSGGSTNSRSYNEYSNRPTNCNASTASDFCTHNGINNRTSAGAPSNVNTVEFTTDSCSNTSTSTCYNDSSDGIKNQFADCFINSVSCTSTCHDDGSDCLTTYNRHQRTNSDADVSDSSARSPTGIDWFALSRAVSSGRNSLSSIRSRSSYYTCSSYYSYTSFNKSPDKST